MKYFVKVNGKQFEVEIEKAGAQAQAAAPVQPTYAPSHIPPVTPAPAVHTPTEPVVSSARNIEVLCPMPSNVHKILVNEGQTVNEGDTLVVLEAMKMEIDVNSPASGVVKQILINVGSVVGADEVLIVLS